MDGNYVKISLEEYNKMKDRLDEYGEHLRSGYSYHFSFGDSVVSTNADEALKTLSNTIVVLEKDKRDILKLAKDKDDELECYKEKIEALEQAAILPNPKPKKSWWEGFDFFIGPRGSDIDKDD